METGRTSSSEENGSSGQDRGPIVKNLDQAHQYPIRERRPLDRYEPTLALNVFIEEGEVLQIESVIR